MRIAQQSRGLRDWKLSHHLLLQLAHSCVVSVAASILVLGGSETSGIDCKEPAWTELKRELRECAWAARLADWLTHTFPKADIQVRGQTREA